MVSLQNKKLTNTLTNFNEKLHKDRAGGRAVDLGGPGVYQGDPKFKIRHKSCCFQKSLLIGGAKRVDWRRPGPLAPALHKELQFLPQ